jgi:GDP-mannose 6-dehydrogenase
LHYETRLFTAPNHLISLGQGSAPLLGLSVIGLGRLGMVAAAVGAQLGHRVLGVDSDIGRIERLAAGCSSFDEPGLDDALTDGHACDLIVATTNILDAVLDSDVTLLCVEAPNVEDGSADLGVLEAAATEVGAALAFKSEYHLVVVRSTVPPGTTRSVVLRALERTSGRTCGVDFGLCYQPDFLREGRALADYFSPPYTVVGAVDERSATVASSLHRGFEAPLHRTTLEAAEMAKYVHTAWGAVGSAFSHEVGRICQVNGIDGNDVMNLFSREKWDALREGARPGFAFGSSAVPRDLRVLTGLAHGSGIDVPLIDSVLRSNDSHIDHAYRRIVESGANRIGFLGMGYDDGTADLSESPQIDLLGRLLESGCRVLAHDRSVDTPTSGIGARRLRAASPSTRVALQMLPDLLTDTPEELVSACDLIVVSRDTPQFAAALAARPATHAVIDLANLSREEQ